MTTPILTTKLYIPPPHPNLVPRPHLIQRLDEGLRLNRKLTLISASAGFGKTTLLSEWLAGRRQGDESAGPLVQSAWVSLDTGDNDPTRFWTYVVAALRTVHADVGESALAAFGSPQPPPTDVILATLINQIAAKADRFCLVLDDYHVIESRPIHETLGFLLDHLPPQMHLAIATRSDPPLPLALLRGRGQLTELRAADLRFTPNEAATFLNRIMELDLSAGEVAALETRTEGWITGLQLAAISMQGRDDVAEFITAFTGSNRFVLDYLTEEVLQRQPESIQTFLLQTSILDQLSGPLCDAVRFGPAQSPTSNLQSPISNLQSQAILDHLERNNLFVVPLDSERRWYRYHRLFADLLRARVEEMQPDRVPELHRRASAWYERQGMTDAAVMHAITAGDLERVDRLIETHGMPMLMRGELTTLLRWMSALPEERILANARFCILHAWTLLLTGQLQAVEPRLQQAERTLGDTPADDRLRGDVTTIRAYVAAQQGDVGRTIELAHLALELLGPDSLGERGIVFFVLGGAHLLRGNVAEAGKALAEASTVGWQGGNIHIAVPALNALAGIQSQQGRLRQAYATAQEGVHLATASTGRPLPIASGPLSALAEVAYEWNDLDRALALARQSVELGLQWGNSDALCSYYLTLAQVLRAQADLEGAQDALQKADRMARQLTIMPSILSQLRAGWARLRLAQGDLSAAARWADDVALDFPDPLHATETLALAQVRLALDQPGAAISVLTAVLDMARAQGLTAIVIEALALQAMAYHVQGDTPQALAALAEALAQAEPEGFVRRFVDLGQEMEALLRRAASHGVATRYVNKLLTAFGTPRPGSPTPPPLHAPTQPLIEPLSPRELQVLALVAEGMSNREVARALFVAESTVKSHLNTIYRKLDVKNRTQAIAQARSLCLLQ